MIFREILRLKIGFIGLLKNIDVSIIADSDQLAREGFILDLEKSILEKLKKIFCKIQTKIIGIKPQYSL